MINIRVSLLEMESGKTITVDVPSSLIGTLYPERDYYISETVPNIDNWQIDDIWELNDLVDEINAENPEMTVEYMDILLMASMAQSAMDLDFRRRICENDFMFEEVTNTGYDLSGQENAAKYLADCAGVPFAPNITPSMLAGLMSSCVENYINWSLIWRKYLAMGFQYVETDSPDYRSYVVLW